MVSRRNFMLGTTSLSALALLGLPSGRPHAQTKAIPTSAKSIVMPPGTSKSTGKAQVNLWFPYGNLDFPFLNMFRMADRIWEAPGATEDRFLLLGANGYPVRMPAGASYWRNYVWGYLASNDNWVLTWDGTASISLYMQTPGVTMTLVSSGTNRQEYSCASSTLPIGSSLFFQVLVGGVAAGFSNIRFFRKSQETLLNGGERFAPHFLSMYRNFGRIRFMDWQATNANPVVSWNNRCTEAQLSWTGANLCVPVYCGTCIQSGSDYIAPGVPQGNPTTWSHGQMIQCVMPTFPTFKDVSGFANTNPAKVTALSHGFSTGDTVIFTQNSLPGVFNSNTYGLSFTVTVVDVNTFTLNGADATTWGPYSSGGKVGKVVRFGAGALPLKRIISQEFGNPSYSVLNAAVGQPLTLVYDQDFDALVFSIAGARLGVPLETLVALANELKVSPWFCIPHGADDNYVTQFATYVRDNLTPTLKACFEFSNEIWNTASGFPQTQAALAKGNLKWGAGWDKVHQWYGYRFSQVMTIIEGVFSGQMQRVERVFSVQTNDPTLSQVTARFQAPAAGLPSYPIKHADSIAIAPYLESNRATTSDAQYVWQNKQGGALAAQAMSWLDNRLRTDVGGWYTINYIQSSLFPIWKGFASTYGVKLTQYEGGWGYIPSLNPLTASSFNGVPLTSSDRDAFYVSYYSSSLFGQTLTDAFKSFIAAGGEYPSQYVVVGSWATSGMWGMITPNIFGTPSPAYSALIALNAS